MKRLINYSRVGWLVFSIPLCVILFCGEQGRATVQQKDAVSIQARIQSCFDTMQDFSATIIQEKRIELFKTAITSTGSITWKKPGMLMIEMNPPDRSQLFFNGSILWIYYPDEKIAERYVLEDRAVFADSFLMFNPFSGNSEDQATSTYIQDGIMVVEFTPTGHLFSRVKIWVAEETCLIQKVKLYGQNGDTTILRYKNASLNSGVCDDIFSFTPPEGTSTRQLDGINLPFH